MRSPEKWLLLCKNQNQSKNRIDPITNTMRADRFLTLYLFGPLTRVFQRKSELRIPILMYHSISDTDETGVHPYYRLCTSPKVFTDQMQYLHENNYSVISLSDAVDLISATQSSPQRPYDSTTQRLNDSIAQQPKYVVLTFDDGYKDFYTDAFPSLKQYGYPATVFLPTDYIGNGLAGLRCKQHLTWKEVRELQIQGIVFGSHTCSHPQLYDASSAALKDELARSRSTIETKTGACDGFCYPYKFPDQDGHFVAVLTKDLKSTGYTYGVSTRIGTVNKLTDLFSLKRVPVNSGDDLPLFQAKLEGRYDWLYNFQATIKRTRCSKSSFISPWESH